MTESVSKSVEDLERERDEWRELAVETSVQRDQAVAALVEVAANVSAPLAKPKTHADPAPAPPPAPPVPMPATLSEWTNLPSAAKAAVRAAHGADIEEKLHEAFMRENKMKNLRGGHSAYAHGPTGAAGGVHLGPSPGTDEYWIGARPNAPRGTASPADLQRAALNASIGTGYARPAAAPAPAPPKGAAPVGAKTRHLGGARK